MENPIKMDDLGVPLFLERPLLIHVHYKIHAVFCWCEGFIKLALDPFLSQTRSNLHCTAPQFGWVKSMPLQSYYEMFGHFNLSSFVSVETVLLAHQKRLTKNAISGKKTMHHRMEWFLSQEVVHLTCLKAKAKDNASFLLKEKSQDETRHWSNEAPCEKKNPFLSACRHRQ